MATRTKRKCSAPKRINAKQDKLKKLKEETPEYDNPVVATPVQLEAKGDVGTTLYLEDGTEAILVPMHHLKAIKKAGVDVEKAGAIQVANGYSVTTKYGLSQAMQAVAAKLEGEGDSKMTAQLAKAIGYCANSMSKMIGEFRQINTMKKPPPGPRNKSFIPGSFVKGNQMVFNGPVQMNVSAKNDVSTKKD
jgi:hypothetical protein